MSETLKQQSPSALTARRLKVTTMLDPAELLRIRASDGQPRVVLRIALPDRAVTADLAAKSVRKAQSIIREVGVENVALMLQGHLIAGDAIAEAGLAAQVKAPKPPVETEAANPAERQQDNGGVPKPQPQPLPPPPPPAARQGDGFAGLRASARARAASAEYVEQQRAAIERQAAGMTADDLKKVFPSFGAPKRS